MTAAASILPFQTPLIEPGRRTVQQLVDYFLAVEKRKYSERSFGERRRQLGQFAARFGTFAAEELVLGDVILWIHSSEGWAAADTKRGVAGLIVRLYTVAMRHLLISRNPMSDLTSEFPQGQPRRPARPEEIWSMLRHSTDALFRRVVLFLYLTGCREQDMCGLTWKEVHFDRRLLLIEKHKTRNKTGKAKPVRLCQRCINLLLWLQRQGPAGPDDRIFSNASGTAWNAANLCNRMRTLRKRGAIQKEVCLHMLRHTRGQEWFDSGAPGMDLKMVSVLLGHTSVKTTEKYYVQATADGAAAERAMNEFERRRREA